MLKRLILDTNISSVLRTRLRQDVEATTRSVLERAGGDPVFAPLLSSYIYATLHHYRPRTDPFDWQTTPQTLVADLANESRAGISLEGPYPSAQLHLDLNSENEIVKERVDGERRNVPKASDRSTASVIASARYFSHLAFAQSYLDLVGDLFVIIGGEYGYANHLSIRHGTDFDRIHRDFFEPSFITWANLFGPELVVRLGRERLLDAPAYQVRELPRGSIMLTVAASPMEQLKAEVQERISRVKTHLGILTPSERAAPEELARFETRGAAAQAKMTASVEEAFQLVREETAAEIKRQADGCVEGVRKFWGERLDFGSRSLAVVDRLIQTSFEPDADDKTIGAAVQAFGAYTGEVVRRSLGGVWHDEEMNGRPVLLNVGNHSVCVEPFCVVSKRFEHRNAREYDLFAWHGNIDHQPD